MLNGWRVNRRSAEDHDRLEAELRDARQRIYSLEEELVARTLAADSAAKELDALTYGISHDLRAPLRAIEGFARILEEDFGETLGEEGASHLTVIRDGAKKLDKLIEGMLALSRVSRQSLARAEVDMNEVARKAVADVCRAREVSPAVVALGPLPAATGDPALLYQVWSQLADNAVKFSSHASAPRIEIGGESRDAANLYFIKDNGAGFEMRYASKLFNVFQRLHSEKEFPGVGVGLAIVHRAVARHGGTVRAEGARDRGAEFSFELPKDGPSASP